MISAIPNDRSFTIFGKSSDTKPTTDKIGNGSQFIEQDTGKIYFYDEENRQWLEFKKSK